MNTIDDTEEICDICSGPVDCECDDPEHCWTCHGTGAHIPEHCCVCGGSPYCQCCRVCGAPCFRSCSCPVAVTLADGTKKTLPPAQGDSVPERDWHQEYKDDLALGYIGPDGTVRDPEPPDDYYAP